MHRIAVLLVALPALAAADPTERRLHPRLVDASSFLWNSWNRFQENYHPLYVADDDPKTAWTEGAASSGAGEWIRLQVTDMDGATRVRLKIRAGYQKTHPLFLANARPRDVTLKLLPGGVEQKTTLEDAEGWQEVVVEQPSGKLAAIQLRVDSVYEGTKYTDLCISDVQVYVTAETRDNPAFEKSNLDKTLAWKAERVAAAKMFQKQAAKELAILPAYRYTYKEPTGEIDWWEKCKGPNNAACVTRVVLARAKADAAFGKKFAPALLVAEKAAGDRAGYVTAQIVPMDKRPIPAVDGLRVPSLYEALEWSFGGNGMELPIVGVLGALRADQLGAFEIKDQVAFDDVMARKAPGCKSKSGKLYAWALKEHSADGKEVLRSLLMLRCGRVEAREGWDDVTQLQVAVYDDDGRLTLVAGPGYVNGFEWSAQKDKPLLIAGRSILIDGGTAELSSPEVAKNP